MATLALSLAGQMVGGLVGGPFGATIGRALGGLAGSAIDGALFGDDTPAAGIPDVRVTGASEGAPIQRVYGWNRISGTVIWAAELERIASEDGGAKGFAPAPEEEIVASFALGLCEGEIAHVGRIWADGKVLDPADVTIRVHRGTPTQAPDGFILARQGAGEVPGYRGLAYIVFERMPIKRFGNRLPNITVEVCRVVGDLEPSIRAVCVIPGSTEFGYDPDPRIRLLGPGAATSENIHQSALRSDWDLSIDELVALCPNLSHVGLVVAWFGTDLRCAECVVEPRVESADKVVKDRVWSVAGRTRETAHTVTTHAGGPAYGGTPDDASVRAAIADLKARGISVTLYPFVMMDIPTDNALPDPYGSGAGQAPYPWRGRITCDPAPGVAGTVDATAGAGDQVTSFMGQGYRAMILHYAGLAQEAGGVEAFLIGSECVGLTTIRDGATSFPFVAALRALAGDVRAIVGDSTRISYAADWTEYSGFQPPDAPGDKIFHLDPLWADDNIDAVGIDNYMPLADWRDDGDSAAPASSIYDLDYLGAQVAGGEGYHWYYASDADRRNGVRSPITDGAHDEPWVYRVKDLVSFWNLPHHDRIGGVRSASPTAWQPEAKPIWLTEIGCGAIDKGVNAPNAFGDPKSAEDRRPYFSTGIPDPLMQRQALRAIHGHWQSGDTSRNPISSHYGGPMVDPARLYVWCWDARPYPAFPARDDVWSDAANYETGHWLNGRLGMAGSGEMLAALARDYGVPLAGATPSQPAITGFAVASLTSFRDAGAPVLAASGLLVADRVDGLHVVAPDIGATRTLDPDDLVAGEGPLIARRRGDPSEAVGQLTLTWLDRARDYQSASLVALAPSGDGLASEALALVLDPAEARHAAQSRLARLGQGDDRIEVALPPTALAFETGDLVTVTGAPGGPFLIEEILDGPGRALRAHNWSPGAARVLPAPRRRSGVPAPVIATPPHLVVAHLPREDGSGTQLVIGAHARPWPGSLTVWDAGGTTELVRVPAAATLGTLASPLSIRGSAIWSRESVEIVLLSGHLASRDPLAVLGGANRIAVQADTGEWEVLGFQTADLVAPGRYRIGHLLRGLRGSRVGAASEGRPVMVLDGTVAAIPAPPERIGTDWGLRVFSGARDGIGTSFAARLDEPPARPLAPVHVHAWRRPDGDIAVDWIRRPRESGDVWSFGDVPLDDAPELYRVTIWNGATAVRVVEIASPGLTYTVAQQAADWGGPAPLIAISVQQVSARTGPGASGWAREIA